MTGLAEERRPQLEKRRLYRTVGVMTVGAIFRDRLMLPEKRSALFAVAGRTGLVDGVLDELRRRRRSMRRMAGSAGHLPFAQRMARQLVEVGVLRLMTTPAHLDLRGGVAHRILRRVQRMAAGTCHVIRGVRAGCPIVCGI